MRSCRGSAAGRTSPRALLMLSTSASTAGCGRAASLSTAAFLGRLMSSVLHNQNHIFNKALVNASP